MRTIVVAERDAQMRENIVREVYHLGRICVFDGYDPVGRGPAGADIDIVFMGDFFGKKTDRALDTFREARMIRDNYVRVLVTPHDESNPSVAFGLRDQTIHYLVRYPAPHGFIKDLVDRLFPDPEPVRRRVGELGY
jgi:hypothetical protein